MNTYNLKKNDIIIILVIFVVFCIFMYVNNYKTIEKFNIIPLKKSGNYSEVDALNKFLEALIIYINKLSELNKTFFDLINLFNNNDYDIEQIFNTDNTDNTDNIEQFKEYLDKIKNILSDMNGTNVEEDSEYLFYDFFKIHHEHIFKDYTTLFDTLRKLHQVIQRKLFFVKKNMKI